MKIPPAKLKKIILEAGFIDQTSLEKAELNAQELEKPLADLLIFRGLIPEESLSQLIAEYYKVGFAPIKNSVIPLKTLKLIPENLARAHRILPFKAEEKTLHLAMEDPEDFEAQEVARRQTGLKIKPYFVTGDSLNRALAQYKKNIRTDFKKIISDNVKKSKAVGDLDLTKIAAELPIVKIFDTIMQYAIAERASDIHLELLEKEVLIRFRIDGLLRDIISLPEEIHPALIARVKVLANLKIDEHRLPQDGRFKFRVDDEFISLRVSILPTFYGENVVMRLLFESARALSLEELGITGRNLEILKDNIKKPHGMILVTGPTGSGKTTTLYSVMNIINTVGVKICTVEDPIEYAMSRISQSQVNQTSGLTFSAGLRSLVRHDPDIIMVGEIRDTETAQMAINAALTGHLVLSTLHTNDAAGAIPRLLDMGAEDFLVASTANLLIAQRLVRRICTNCIERYKPDAATTKVFAQEGIKGIEKQDFYRGKGCEECGQRGYRGRVGIYELLEVTPKIRELIIKKVPASQIKDQATKEGMTTMLVDGLNKVAAGITTVEEVLRAVRE